MNFISFCLGVLFGPGLSKPSIKVCHSCVCFAIHVFGGMVSWMVLSLMVSIYFFTSQQVANSPATVAPLAWVVSVLIVSESFVMRKAWLWMPWGSRMMPPLLFLPKCMTRWLLIDSWAFLWMPSSDLPRSAPPQALRQLGEATATLGLLCLKLSQMKDYLPAGFP